MKKLRKQEGTLDNTIKRRRQHLRGKKRAEQLTQETTTFQKVNSFNSRVMFISSHMNSFNLIMEFLFLDFQYSQTMIMQILI